MFDVSWSDPSRETVGQRKTRKEQSHNSVSLSRAGSRVSEGARSGRSSTSGDSTTSQLKPSFLNIFGPTYKKQGPKRGEIQAHSTTALASTLEVESPTDRRPSSCHTINASNPEVIRDSVATPAPTVYTGNNYLSDIETSPSEVSESIFSDRTGRSTNTASTWSSVIGPRSSPSPTRIVQPLSLTSFVTQSTEITVSTRENLRNTEHPSTIVQISSDGTVPIQGYNSTNKSERDPPAAKLEPLSQSETPFQSNLISRSKEELVQTQEWPISPRCGWHPPDDWDCSPEKEEPLASSKPAVFELPSRPVKLRRANTKARGGEARTFEMTSLQRSMCRMEAASDRIVLERLKEEWIGIADASVYRELELEKQLWMLTALRRRQGKRIQDLTEPGKKKILSLFENHASCSALSSLATASQIHHVSTSPLSPKHWPNIHPLTVPGPTSQLPYAPEIFTSIHAFSLPAILPSASIPTMLKECHRTLVSGPPAMISTPPESFSVLPATLPDQASKAGVLHLTILDPAPLPSTLGPRLRAWLEHNLILNLEKQFKCTSPGRLFPIWLADAGLRAAGSTILPIQFLACYSPSMIQKTTLEESEGKCSNTDETEQEDGTEQELKSVLGRMLWKEMWGAYVQAENWWWEDENIVEECQRMHTCWEYAIIEAVKQI